MNLVFLFSHHFIQRLLQPRSIDLNQFSGQECCNECAFASSHNCATEEKKRQHNSDNDTADIEDNLDIAERLADRIGDSFDECFCGVEYLIGDDCESYTETADCYADEYHAQLCEIRIDRDLIDYYHAQICEQTEYHGQRQLQ